jgi:hypothetical protein
MADYSWPEGVTQMNIGQMGHLGVHETNGRLYWRGKEVITRHELGSKEYFLASLVAWATAASALIAGAAFAWEVFFKP